MYVHGLEYKEIVSQLICQIVFLITFFLFHIFFVYGWPWVRCAIFLQDDFTSEDFANMPAPLAYQMFKAKTEYPLHAAIRAKREDVVFLYMVEHDSQVST